MTVEQLFEVYQSCYDDLRILSTPITKEVKQLEERLRREYEEKFSALREDVERLRAMLLKPGRTIDDIKRLEETRKIIVEELRKLNLVTKVKE